MSSRLLRYIQRVRYKSQRTTSSLFCHLKALYHLSFSSLFYFCEYGTFSLKVPILLSFPSLIDFLESRPRPLKSTNHFFYSSYLSSFANLILLRLLSTTQPWAVQSDVMSSSSFGDLLHSLRLKSSLVYMISSMPTQASWFHLSPKLCVWTSLLFSMPPTQLTKHFRWRRNVLFPLGSRCTSCYATYVTYAVWWSEFSD